ncbi:MAG: HD domain-containing protein, partial [Deltaproteobacteria bacterium]
LAKDKPDLNAEGETADWSLAKDKPDLNAEGETADWSLAKDKPDLNAEGETADWSLAKEDPKRAQLIEQVRTEPTLSELKKGKEQRKREKDEDNDYDKSKYKRVRIRRFLNFSNVDCDVFLKLRKDKFIKIINAGEGYNEEQLERYQQKSVRYVFIPIEQHENFMDAFTDLIMDKLSIVQNMSVEVKQAAELVVFDHIHNMATEYGISKKTATMVRGAIQSNLDTLKKMGNIMDIIDKMMKGKSYISEHSLLLSYISGQICMKTSWGNQNSLEKLSMAALFHDCCIEDDSLAIEHDEIKKISKEWTKDEQHMIEEHAGKAASLINAGENIFSDVDTIIIQHHENPEGTGYPRKLGSLSIAPLSATFIIAEDFVSRIFGKSKDEIDVNSIKKEFEIKYNKGNYKKPLKAFLEAF